MAEDFKAKGNAAFASGNFDEAIEHFSKGIEVDASNHVLYSNRSAAQASLKRYRQALTDAQKVVELKPDWPKGYSRLGAANQGLGNWDEAIEAYEKGLQLEPQNEANRKALEDSKAGKANAANGGMGGPGGLFGSDFMARLAMNPTTRPLLSDPEFQTILREVQTDPMKSMTKHLANPKFKQAMSVGLGMNIMGGDEAAEQGFGSKADQGPQDADMPSAASEPAQTRNGPTSAKPAPSPEPMEEEPEVDSSKAEAQKAKEAGNAAYKAKKFEEAIGFYDKAIGLDDTDISFLTNRAAVHFEMGNLEQCIKDCEAAVERGRELRLDYKLIGKALTRKGNALVKQGKLDEAVETYHKALTEHRNPDTLKRLNDTEKKLKEQRENAYVNLDLSNQEREKGNEAFRDQKYPEAVKYYSEALKRGPAAVNPEAHKLYSNRAACFTKLGAYPDGIKDADECIALKPDFPKGYSRKGLLQFLMKDYDKAIATYQEGLQNSDKDNEELRSGLQNCLATIDKMRTGQADEEDVKQRRARAMQDPEVQRILTDPIMRQVLEDLQNDPKSQQQHLAHPQIRANLEKLVSAGIVQMR